MGDSFVSETTEEIRIRLNLDFSVAYVCTNIVNVDYV